MIVAIACPFCRAAIRVSIDGARDASGTDLGSMKCPACESRIGFELKILRKSKSAKRKRAEAEDHQRKREIVQRLESEANAERVQLAAEPGCICETIGFPTGSTWDAELQVMRPIKPRHHYQCPRNPNYMPPGTRLERDGDDDADAG